MHEISHLLCRGQPLQPSLIVVSSPNRRYLSSPGALQNSGGKMISGSG